MKLFSGHLKCFQFLNKHLFISSHSHFLPILIIFMVQSLQVHPPLKFPPAYSQPFCLACQQEIESVSFLHCWQHHHGNGVLFCPYMEDLGALFYLLSKNSIDGTKHFRHYCSFATLEQTYVKKKQMYVKSNRKFSQLSLLPWAPRVSDCVNPSIRQLNYSLYLCTECNLIMEVAATQ